MESEKIGGNESWCQRTLHFDFFGASPVNPLRVSPSPKPSWLETPTSRREIMQVGRCVTFSGRMPKRVDSSVTPEDARGYEETNTKLVGLAMDGVDETAFVRGGCRAGAAE